jgi:hypothetical protein
MSKFVPILAFCLFYGGAAFGGDITAGFSRDDTKNVVVDSIYKLMWQDGKEIYRGTYDEAIKYCDNLSFAGFDDWRLPTVNELISITDKSKFNPAINSVFKYVESSDYWSSTKHIVVSSWWIVDFVYGGGGWNYGFNRSFVLCVRQY